MTGNELDLLRNQLKTALTGQESHITFDAVFREFPKHLRGAKPPGAPHTAWELLEHIRIAQRDILEFIRDPAYRSPKFPEGYWPDSEAPADNAAWDASVRALNRDVHEFQTLIDNEDLFTPLKHGDGQTLLREALVAANHNSYHLGQIVYLKRMPTETS